MRYLSSEFCGAGARVSETFVVGGSVCAVATPHKSENKYTMPSLRKVPIRKYLLSKTKGEVGRMNACMKPHEAHESKSLSDRHMNENNRL